MVTIKRLVFICLLLSLLISKAFSNRYTHEKVYLHFDNTSYYLGEKLWFKAYVTSAQRQLAPLSTVLYVELLNQYGQQVERQVLKLENGTANGQLMLDTGMLPGFYEVRAYTRLMRNFGDTNYFSRVFPFYVEPVDGKYERETYRFNMSSNWDMKTRPEIKSKKIAVDFYPEGGHLVRDIPSVIAFRITTKEEPYPMASMTICSHTGDSIGECFTAHDGMGRFTYRPGEKPGYIRVHYDNTIHRFNLPDAEPEGYCLSVGTQKNDSITVLLRRSSSLPLDTLGFALASGGDIYRTLPIVFNQEILGYKLPLEGLPAGVAQALLFNKQGDIVSERMFFVNRPEALVSIAVRADKKIYSPGEKVNLAFDITSQDKGTVTTGFSLSVRDALSSDLNLLADNARTNLLLASDLSGYIHHPEYYFRPDGKVRATELDILMLVHGWRKYDWKAILTQTKELPHPVENSLMLEGRLKSLLTKSPQSNELISLMVKDDTVSFATTILTDSAGHFRIPLNDFTGRCRALFVANNHKSGKQRRFCYFLLDRNFAPSLRAYQPSEFAPQWDRLSEAVLSQLQQVRKEEMERLYGKNFLLDEVEVKGRFRSRPMVIKEQNVLAYFEVENIVEEDWDKGIEYSSLTDFLQKKNYLASPHSKGLDAEEMAQDTMNSMGGMTDENVNNPNTVFIVDGVFSSRYHNQQLKENVLMEVEGVKTLMYCEGTLLDDKFKDLMKGTMEVRLDVKGSGEDNLASAASELRDKRSNHGIYYITTTGEFDMHKKNRAAYGTRLTYINGYNTPQEFYSPNYSQQTLPIEQDHRRTLYWNPSLRTDESGRCDVTFYNASNYTCLNVNAETVTSQGEVGSINLLTK